jgi:hypothetical protein
VHEELLELGPQSKGGLSFSDKVNIGEDEIKRNKGYQSIRNITATAMAANAGTILRYSNHPVCV